MEVYLDKNFVRNYWGVSVDKSILNAFENNFLKQLKKCTVICNYENLEEIQSSEDDSVLFDLILESGHPDIVFLPDLTSDENLISCMSNGDTKLFFVEIDEEKITELEKEYGYRIITTNTLEKKWHGFIQFEQVEKSVAEPVEESDDDIFNKWEDLSFIKLFPTNSIVFVDKYILSDKKNSRLKNNLIPLLHNLIPETYTGELSIVILSEMFLSDDKKLIDQAKAQRIHQILNRKFAKYKNVKLKFTIVSHNKSFYAGNQPVIHDRYIYTNYFTLTSGSGFDLFNDNGDRKIINSNVVIDFNFRKHRLKTLPAILEGLRHYFQKIRTIQTVQFKSYPEKFDCALLD